MKKVILIIALAACDVAIDYDVNPPPSNETMGQHIIRICGRPATSSPGRSVFYDKDYVQLSRADFSAMAIQQDLLVGWALCVSEL